MKKEMLKSRDKVYIIYGIKIERKEAKNMRIAQMNIEFLNRYRWNWFFFFYCVVVTMNSISCVSHNMVNCLKTLNELDLI